MSKELQDLFDEIHRRGTNVAKFSRDTGIPVDRIYQWKKGNGNPKAADAAKIKAWLTEKPDKVQGVQSSDPANDALIQMLILEIAKIKSKIYGISVDDAIDELEKNARIALRQGAEGLDTVIFLAFMPHTIRG